MRLLSSQDARDVARLRVRQEGGSENVTPRPYQPRDRRSPPSEAENRRRTRARHSSFHPSHPAGSLAGGPGSRASMGAPVPGQQSPTRERVMTPSVLPWPISYSQDLNRSLTSYHARQSMPGAQRLFYTPSDLRQPPNAAPQMEQPAPNSNMGPGGFATGNAASMHMHSPNHPAYYPGMSFGTASTAAYPPQLPPVGALSTPAYQSTSYGGNGAPNPGSAEGQMQ